MSADQSLQLSHFEVEKAERIESGRESKTALERVGVENVVSEYMPHRIALHQSKKE